MDIYFCLKFLMISYVKHMPLVQKIEVKQILTKNVKQILFCILCLIPEAGNPQYLTLKLNVTVSPLKRNIRLIKNCIYFIKYYR